MNRRRALLTAGCGLVLTASLRAQPTGRVHRIGVLFNTNRAITRSAGYWQPFEERLRQLGYIEGKNLVIEERGAEGRVERLPALAAELDKLKPDVIVAGAEAAALAVKNAVRTIPVVFVAAGDPIGLGLVKSLARPEGNVTGFSSFSDRLVPKRIEMLRELYPKMVRLAVVHQPGDAASMQQVAAVLSAAKALQLTIGVHTIQAAADIDAVFDAIGKEAPEAMMVCSSSLTFIHRKRISELATALRIPAVYGFAGYVRAGGLMSYGFSFADNYRRTAEYVDRILRGAKVAELPVQEPVKFELAINLKAAKALGGTIPKSLIFRADVIVED